jgi:hypothetical protein
MSKVGVLVLADGETPESLGRVVNALMVARELKDGGDEVTVVFDGAGTKGVSAFADPSHDYNELFEAVRDRVAGACDYCAGAFQVKEDVQRVGVELLDEYKGHPSVKKLVERGYEVVSF